MLLYKTASPVIVIWSSSNLNSFFKSFLISAIRLFLFSPSEVSTTLVEILTTESSLLIYEYNKVSFISSGKTDLSNASSRSFKS